MLDQREQLVGFPALGDEDRDVVRADDPEVPVNAVGWMQKRGGRAGGRERRGDLAADESRLANAGHDDAALCITHQLDRAGETVAERIHRRCQCVALHLDDATATRNDAIAGIAAHGAERSATYASASAFHSPRAFSSSSAN